jgi:hypothetical protein
MTSPVEISIHAVSPVSIANAHRIGYAEHLAVRTRAAYQPGSLPGALLS